MKPAAPVPDALVDLLLGVAYVMAGLAVLLLLALFMAGVHDTNAAWTAELAEVYPSALTTPEVIERRTGQRYDANESYRALRGLEARGIVTVFRDCALRTVAWAVIR